MHACQATMRSMADDRVRNLNALCYLCFQLSRLIKTFISITYGALSRPLAPVQIGVIVSCWNRFAVQLNSCKRGNGSVLQVLAVSRVLLAAALLPLAVEKWLQALFKQDLVTVCLSNQLWLDYRYRQKPGFEETLGPIRLGLHLAKVSGVIHSSVSQA